MPSARELLEQADALMRRNRGRAVDTEIPELTDVVTAIVPSPPTVLDDVPELTDAVEEIEIQSVAEMPDDAGEPSAWLTFDRGTPRVIGGAVVAIVAPPSIPPARVLGEEPAQPAHVDARTYGGAGAAMPSMEPVPVAPTAVIGDAPPDTLIAGSAAATPGIGETPTEPPIALAPSAVPGNGEAPSDTVIAEAPAVSHAIEEGPPDAANIEEPDAGAPSGDAWRPEIDAPAPMPRHLQMASTAAVPEPPPAVPEPAPQAPEPAPQAPDLPRAVPVAPADDWARWEALAEEIRMQVLQRIDIFTDAGLREQLGAQLQPIVDRASAELVATINEQVGKLLRAYIAEAIEREIEKWRKGNG